MVTWLKMNVALGSNVKVRSMARDLGVTTQHVVGALHAVWSWADAHTETGVMDYAHPDDVDDVSGTPGMAVAMVGVGWLVVAESQISLPRYCEHNGETAKRRCSEAARRGRKRKAQREAGQ